MVYGEQPPLEGETVTPWAKAGWRWGEDLAVSHRVGKQVAATSRTTSTWPRREARSSHFSIALLENRSKPVEGALLIWRALDLPGGWILSDAEPPSPKGIGNFFQKQPSLSTDINVVLIPDRLKPKIQ